jgi:hypothetical protein
VKIKRHRTTYRWQRLIRRRGPLTDRLGFPTARHPESITRELPGAQEEWLAGIAAALWPEDEYVEIIRGGRS